MTLAPISGRSGTRAVRLTDAEGVAYWLEYRTATDRDAWLGTAANRFRLQTGVLLRRAEGLPDTSVLLDGTPGAASAWDTDLQTALPVGAAVPVSGGDFTVVVQGVTAAGAVLTVTPTSTPTVSAGVPADRPVPATPGTVLPGSADAPQGAAPPVGDAAGFSALPYDGAQSLRANPELESAADSSTGGGLLVPLAGAVLAAAALFVVRTCRRSWLRRA